MSMFLVSQGYHPAREGSLVQAEGSQSRKHVAAG